MEQFTHYVITRFNIVQRWYSTANNNKTTFQTDEWLHWRIQLFERYTLPTMMQQTNTNYVWLIQFNAASPDYLKSKIQEWQSQCLNITPLFLEPYGDENALVRGYIREHTTTPYIITTRIDSDDMVHRCFVERIQQAFREDTTDRFYNFPNGYQYHAPKGTLVYWKGYYSNHYVSRFEPNTESFKSVLCDHSDVTAFATYEESEITEPMWMEVIHGKNVANSHIGARPLSPKQAMLFHKSSTHTHTHTHFLRMN